ncbi:uncharacterized protein LOC104584365 [Brachypodium distachyon]|uniref:Uncharacterized protein n=1 Tax=Brachypodium distachyon TaxID=15368 RepID=A0A0Q3L1B9_BRADI|nr:uncharacterized protein LOC104584365 [Brachypodium distachyon]KQJ86149.1 hypothetical protein BRADI_4g03640v3 [Brachypodium distachyon]|eukprot:XP_010237113.1 uncharacterized protein LOC104584365 [Brachypodium distachyon]
MPPEMVKCSTCGKTYKSMQALCDHEDKCKSPEKLGRNAAGQEEASSSAQCGQLGLNVPDNYDNPAFDDPWGSNNDVLGFGMPKQKQPSLTEPEQKLDVVEAPQPLQEQLGEDTTSVDEPGTDSPGDKSGTDYSDEVLTSCSEKSSPSLAEPEHKLDVVEAPQSLQGQLGGDITSEDEPGTDSPGDESAADDPHRDTTSDDEPGTDSPGDESAADDSHRDTTSDDEPGTDSPGGESAADDSHEVLTSDPEKSSCSVECYAGGERMGNLQDVLEQVEVYRAAHTLLMLKSEADAASGGPIGGIEKGENGIPVVEVEPSCTDDCQRVSGCSGKPAVSELKRPKLDPEILHDSAVAVTQEKKQKIDLDAPAPTNSSGEERSNVTDSQTSQST